MASRIVPFPRELHLGNKGDDVQAVKRALRKVPPQNTLVSNTSEVYGPGTVKAVKTFQKRRKLKVDGIYGRATHTKLAPYFDAYGTYLMAKAKKQQDKPHPRELLTAVALALRNYQVATRRVHYTQGSARMTIVRRHYHVKDYSRRPIIYEDCSSAVTGYFWQVGLPDPNDLNYSGYGYTGTLCRHGTVVASPLPGDLIFYGRNPPWSHVAIAVGDDPFSPTDRCVSHGHEGGPFLTSVRYRGDLGQIRSYVSRRR